MGEGHSIGGFRRGRALAGHAQNVLALAALTGVALAGGAATVFAQGASGAPIAPSARWTIRESATLDLWYHGLATIGYDGFGPLPYHAPGYAADLRRAKTARGIPPTPLERDAATLRAALQRDSAFEVLHFLPLHFASADPATLIRVVQAVASGGSAGPLPPAQRAAVDALRSAVASPAERATLARLAADLDVEWREFYGDWWSRSAAGRGEAIAALQRRWDERFLPALAAPLAANRLTSGAIYLVPALGPEGRVLADTPRGWTTIAAWWPAAYAADDAPLFSIVRELCFPLVRRLPIAADADRVAAEGESARAAVRCGAELLDATAPAMAAGYRETFRRGATPAGARRGFDEIYRLSPPVERALAREVSRLLAPRSAALH